MQRFTKSGSVRLAAIARYTLEGWTSAIPDAQRLLI